MPLPPGFVLEPPQTPGKPPPGFELEGAAPAGAPAHSTGKFITSNINAGLADLAGLPTDTAANLMDLLNIGGVLVRDPKGFLGLADPKIAPKDLPELQDRLKMLGSSEQWQSLMRKVGAITPDIEGQSSAERVIGGALRALPSAALGRPTGLLSAAKSATGALSGGAAAQVVAEGGGDPASQMLGGMLPGFTGHVLTQKGNELAHRALAGNADVPARELVLRQAGITSPSGAQVTGNNVLAGAENTIARLPGGGSPSVAAAAQRATGMQEKVGGLVSRLGGAVSAEAAGEIVQAGAQRAVEHYRDIEARGYRQFDKLVNPKTHMIDLRKTEARMDEVLGVGTGLSHTLNAISAPALRSMRTALLEDIAITGGQTSLADAKRLRSRLGELFAGGQVVEGSIAARDARSLYRSLTDDIRASLSPAEQKAWDQGNRISQAWHDRYDKVWKPLIAENTPEKALSAAMDNTARGASAFRKVMKGLTPVERNEIAAYVVDNLGKAAKGQQNAEGDKFSSTRFLTQWNGLSEGAKDALFPSVRTRGDMNVLAKAADYMKEAGAAGLNPSGTAGASARVKYAGMIATGVIGDAFVNPAQAAAIGGVAVAQFLGTRYAARAMSSPAYIRWLADGVRRPDTPGADYLARLAVIAKDTRDPETKAAIEVIMQSLGLPAR